MKLTKKEQLARSKVCLPLDNLETMNTARQRVEELHPVVGSFKVGKGSYTRFGPAIIEMVHGYDAEVFLDLKYKDIPNTVKDAAEAATELGVYMFNVHASGGSSMMKAAVEGANNAAGRYNLRVPKIIGVTVLTSIDQEVLTNELKVDANVEDQVLHYARLTDESGLDGIVCSGADLSAIRNHLPENFMYVTPGIKGPNTSAGKDQKRVLTPGRAVNDGSTILVIGRAITGHKTSEERLQAGYEVLQDMAKYL